MSKRRGGIAVAVLVFACAIGAAGLVAGGSAPTARARGAALRGSQLTSGSSEHVLTASLLAAYLRAAASITKVPANLIPPLSDHYAWGPVIVFNGCQLSALSPAMSPPCVYGDADAHTTVALFGDSHAGVWFPALNQISIERHWRLVDFTRSGCSPPEVTLNPECDIWRQNTEAQIAALHPAIVFVSWARWIEDGAGAAAGVPTGYGSPWLDGIAAIFKFLRRSSRRVIFISDVPTLGFGARQCVIWHLTDMRRCNRTPRTTAIFLPKIRAAEFQLADRTGVASIDPTPWFCTPTVCPVLVHDLTVYYDSAHMTPPWSRFIAPVLDASITSILGHAQGVRPS